MKFMMGLGSQDLQFVAGGSTAHVSQMRVWGKI